MAQIKPKSHYDSDADVLYISFSDDLDEPTYSKNVDDFVLINIGWFSKLPRGLTILGAKAKNVKNVTFKVVIKHIEKQIDAIFKQYHDSVQKQQPAVRNFIEKELGNMV